MDLTKIKNSFMDAVISDLKRLGFSRFRKSRYFIKPHSDFDQVLRLVFFKVKGSICTTVYIGVRVNKLTEIRELFDDIYNPEIKKAMGTSHRIRAMFETNGIRLTGNKSRSTYCIQSEAELPSVIQIILEIIEQYGIDYLRKYSDFGQIFQLIWGTDEKSGPLTANDFFLLSLLNAQINSGREYVMINEKIVFRAKNEIKNFDQLDFEFLKTELDKLQLNRKIDTPREDQPLFETNIGLN